MKNLPEVTRFEVIDNNGRVLAYYDVHVSVDIQDDGRTMKVFISPKPKDNLIDQRVVMSEELCDALIDVWPCWGKSFLDEEE